MIVAAISIAAGRLVIERYRKGPVCEIEFTHLDYGAIPLGYKAVKSVRLRNSGNSDLLIHSVLPACGCMGVRLDSQVIRPGVHATLMVAIMADRYGLRESGVLLETNDTDHPRFMLSTTCKVDNKLSIVPNLIDFGYVDSSDLPLTSTLSLANIPYESPTGTGNIITCESNVDYICTSAAPTEQRKGTEIIVTLLQKSPIGAIYTPLRLAYDGTGLYIETIVKGIVRGWCLAVPPSLDLGVLTKHGKATTQSVNVFNRHQTASINIHGVTMDRVLADLCAIRTEVVNEEDHHSVRVLLDCKNYRHLWTSSVYSGLMTIECSDSHGRTASIAVPLRVSISSK